MAQTLDKTAVPDSRGHFGPYGGMYVPETLMTALYALTDAYESACKDPAFQAELDQLLRDYVGRPTELYFAERLTDYCGGAKIYLKREDGLHTGAHKINHCVGQALICKRMGKTRVIAETGAGQHGTATAAVAAKFGFDCTIYMGEVDMQRQALNVFRMELMGAKVVPVTTGQRTLKDAVNEAMRDWVTNVEDTHYILGSALGAHPYPMMVRDFQSVVGQEARRQILELEGRLPDECAACVGGGCNSIGLFYAFLEDENVKLTGIEAGGRGIRPGAHAARFSGGRLGVLQGAKTYVLQTGDGQIDLTHSISAGLDYAAVGPEHAYYRDLGRICYEYATDAEVLDAFQKLSQCEGIIPALESTHAIAYALKRAPQMRKDEILLINLSGRGDKDAQQAKAAIEQARSGSV